MIIYGPYQNIGSFYLPYSNEEKEKVKVGFFGGSFDPIHFGHLRIAKELAVACHLSQVWFCPANVNPFKLEKASIPIEHRLNMIQLAIEDEPLFALLDIEAKREVPSYTIDTIKELVALEEKSTSPRQIYLILSDETAPQFFDWKLSEEIVKLVPLLVGSRFQTPLKNIQGDSFIVEALEKGWHPTVPLEISSTEIRERLFNGQSCEAYVPKKVLDYIFQNKLYSLAN